MGSKMKTLAITIEEDTLQRIDKFVSKNRAISMSRSRFIREALQEHLSRGGGQAEDEREREIMKLHCRLLQQEALALIKEQAKV